MNLWLILANTTHPPIQSGQIANPQTHRLSPYTRTADSLRPDALFPSNSGTPPSADVRLQKQREFNLKNKLVFLEQRTSAFSTLKHLSDPNRPEPHASLPKSLEWVLSRWHRVPKIQDPDSILQNRLLVEYSSMQQYR